jgi:hypothetical protein
MREVLFLKCLQQCTCRTRFLRVCRVTDRLWTAAPVAIIGAPLILVASMCAQLEWDTWTAPRNFLNLSCSTATTTSSVATRLLFVPETSNASEAKPVCVPACPVSGSMLAVCSKEGTAMPYSYAEAAAFCSTPASSNVTYSTQEVLRRCVPVAAIDGTLYEGSKEQITIGALALTAQVWQLSHCYSVCMCSTQHTDKRRTR